MKYALDAGVRRRGGGRLLVGGAPARALRLSAAGAAALDRLLGGEPADPGTRALGERLRGHGMLHPVAPVPAPAAAVTFVVPVRDGGERLVALVAQLRERGPVIVVDDGSRDGAPARAAAAGARVIANPGPPGPAAARNLGLAAAASELVAFVDADCRCPADWAGPLAALLAEDPGLALAAPRVRSAPGAGAIARYERRRSPLDMGPSAALVGPGARVAYVPSAALLARRAALSELGGFDQRLRFGEDVDLVWRARAAGWSVRYAPEVEVEHLPRDSLADLARQRFGYGGSAVELDRRHPGAVAPLRLDPGAAGVLATLLAAHGRRGLGLVALAGAGRLAAAARGAPSPELRPALAALAARSLLASGARLAGAATREWLPLTLAAGLLCRRGRRLALLALAIDAGRDPAGLPLRLTENAAYATGLWRAALTARAPGALLPRLVTSRGAASGTGSGEDVGDVAPVGRPGRPGGAGPA